MATGLGLGQFAFVGTFIAAVKKTIAGPRRNLEHLKCVITQELFTDPVVLVQTGYTYERAAILRWLNAKFPPTDPTSNVELWCQISSPTGRCDRAWMNGDWQNGYGVLDPPEEATRVTKDGTHVARRSAKRDVRRRAHPPVSAGVASRASATSGNLSISHDFHAGNHHGDDAHRGAQHLFRRGRVVSRRANRVVRRGSRAERCLVGGVGAFLGSRIGQGHTPIRPLGCVRKKQSGALISSLGSATMTQIRAVVFGFSSVVRT